jgi:hypothetical protein
MATECIVRNTQSRATAWIVVTLIALAARTVMAVDVKIDFDKEFNFKAARTWAWRPDGPGEVRMARTPDDDPEAMRRQVEPVIVNAVTSEMDRRGLKAATATPDLFVNYYLLLTIGSSAQTIGQFLGPYQWSVPPFTASTQSLEVMNHGSLVLDFTVKETVVWRGIAQANVRIGTDIKRREALIREAVRDLLRRFPPRS